MAGSARGMSSEMFERTIKETVSAICCALVRPRPWMKERVMPKSFSRVSCSEVNLMMTLLGNMFVSGCGWQRILMVGGGQSPLGHGKVGTFTTGLVPPWGGGGGGLVEEMARAAAVASEANCLRAWSRASCAR